MQLSHKQKTFPQFFLPFSKFGFNIENFETKAILIADWFSKLQSAKNVFV